MRRWERRAGQEDEGESMNRVRAEIRKITEAEAPTLCEWRSRGQAVRA